MKYIQNLVLFCFLLFFSSCSLQSLIKKSSDQQLVVDPAPLELHGDSVKFTLIAQLLPKMMKKNTTFCLIPRFEYSGKVYSFDEPVVFDRDEHYRNDSLEQQK